MDNSMKKGEVLAVVGMDSGEYKGIFKQQRKKKVGYGQWLVLNSDALPDLVERLSAAELQFFLRLLALSKDENLLYFSQKELAESLGMTHAYVNRCVNGLVEKGLLAHRGIQFYEINPEIAWKGDWKKNPLWQVREEEPSYGATEASS